PFVSIAVGVILFEAGLRLSFRDVSRGVHAVVARLVSVGVAVTWIGIAVAVALLFGGMDRGVAILIGAILVVSGPTVVLPLLTFIRPTGDVRSLLKWEGVLVDPVGAILGVLVFLGVQSARAGGAGWRPGELLLSVGVLFVLVAASVSPSDVKGVMPEALVLVAVMVIVVRPVAVMLATWRSAFTLRERAFVAWMAPRGIVAGATASAFGPQLARHGI